MKDKDFEELTTENIDWEEMGAENRELLRDWSQRKEQELIDVATQCQHASSVCPVGRDRFHRRYWVFRSVPGLFVEEDRDTDTISTASRNSAVPPSTELQTDNLLESLPNSRIAVDTIAAMSDSCQNSDILSSNELPTDSSPESSSTRWSVYGSVDAVEGLLVSLNTRGIREGPLKAVLVDQRDRLKDLVSQCDLDGLSVPISVGENRNDSSAAETENTSSDQTVADENESLVLAVCGMVLDLEERVYSGSLGCLRVRLFTLFH